MLENTKIILASASPRRRELLSKLGLAFEVITSNQICVRKRGNRGIKMNQGIDTIITNGKHPERIYDVVEEKAVGTKFTGKQKE